MVTIMLTVCVHTITPTNTEREGADDLVWAKCLSLKTI